MGDITKVVVIASCLFFSLVYPSTAHPAGFNVLVVMSYEEPAQNPWCGEVKEGIDSVLGAGSALDYFYMNTKINPQGGPQMAREAHAKYLEKRYDGVIAVDDDAQKLFVVPFLRDRAETPVIFCGVNAAGSVYGYPASNVTGILERGHFRESVALIQQLLPEVKRIVFIARDSTSGQALHEQILQEAATYSARLVAFELVTSLADIASRESIGKSDTIIVDSLRGILDNQGRPLGNREVIQYLSDTFKKPVVGANNAHLHAGALCAVVKSGQEQGEVAAEMLLKAMTGTPLSKLPITRNYQGSRVINVSTMKRLKIEPKPGFLLGAKLIKSLD